MAGKRHHTVPKFLQKGFASKIDGDTVFTWLYRKKSVSPKEVSTKDTIVGEHFYGRKGESNADDSITYLEQNKFSPLIDTLRSGKCNFDKSKLEIAEMISHFSVRTKLVRESFSQVSKRMIGGIREILTDENVIEDVLLKPREDFLETQIEEVLANTNNEKLAKAIEIFDLIGFEKDDFKKMVTQITYESLDEDESKNEMKDIVKGLFSQIFDESNALYPKSIKEGHNKSLAENTIPLPRVKEYEQLDWNIYEVNSPLILGDVACIFREFGGNSFRSSCTIEKTGQIYLPISSNQILIGTFNSEKIETNVKVLNEAIVKCSYEQFICSEKSDDKIDLIQFIGTDAYIVSDEEIETELSEIRSNIQNINTKNDL